MTRGVRGEGGRRDERHPVRVGRSVGVAVQVGVPDARHRAPVVVVVLEVPRDDRGVRLGDAQQREQARVVEEGEAPQLGDVLREDQPVARWRCGARPVGPEERDLRLLGGARRAVGAAQALDLAEGRRVLGRAGSGRRDAAELRAAGHRPRRDERPVGVQGRREGGGSRRPPGSTQREVRGHYVGGVIGRAQRQDLAGHLDAPGDARALRGAVRDDSEAGCERAVEGRLLRREERGEGGVRGRRGRGVDRGAAGRWALHVVGVEAAEHPDDRVVDRDVDASHGAGRAGRRGAVDADGVEQDLVPVEHHVRAGRRGREREGDADDQGKGAVPHGDDLLLEV